MSFKTHLSRDIIPKVHVSGSPRPFVYMPITEYSLFENYFSIITNEIFIPHFLHIPVCQVVNKCMLAKMAFFF